MSVEPEDIGNAVDIVDAWISETVVKLLEAGWAGQHLEVDFIDHEDGSSTVVFDWKDEDEETI